MGLLKRYFKRFWWDRSSQQNNIFRYLLETKSLFHTLSDKTKKFSDIINKYADSVKNRAKKMNVNVLFIKANYKKCCHMFILKFDD